MPDPVDGLDGISVVIRGNFNPSIFSPAWLLEQDLIGKGEFTEASVEVITQELAIFKCVWLGVQATYDGLVLSADSMEYAEQVRDVAVGALRTLSHTPVGGLGVNRHTHMTADDSTVWHKVGDTLAPKDIWDEILSYPGLRTMSVWGARPDSLSGRVAIQVEPSLRVPNGIFVQVNDHYNLIESKGPAETRDDAIWQINAGDVLEPSATKIDLVVQILTDGWNASLDQAERAFRTIGALTR